MGKSQEKELKGRNEKAHTNSEGNACAFPPLEPEQKKHTLTFSKSKLIIVIAMKEATGHTN